MTLPRPPRGAPAVTTRRYLSTAFAEPRNRARADRVFVSLMRQIGTFWGTILGLRGYSRGESLVARNVGNAAGWNRGRRSIRLVFMDHDNLHFPTRDHEHLYVDRILGGTAEDWDYAVGDSSSRDEPFTLVDHLRSIYRVGTHVSDVGDLVLRQSLARSYLRTRVAVDREPSIAALFSPNLREESSAWDRIVAQSRPSSVPRASPDGCSEHEAPRMADEGPDATRFAHLVASVPAFEKLIEKLFSLRSLSVRRGIAWRQMTLRDCTRKVPDK